MLSPHRTASRLLWSWALGRLKRSDPPGAVATLQGQFSGDRLLDKAKLLQHFGFASRPPVETDLVAICPSGEPSSAIVIATNHQKHRPPALEEGDAALYDLRGAYVWMSKDGLQVEARNLPVVIRSATTVTVTASEKVRLETPRLEVTGEIVDHCDAGTPTLKTLRDDYNAHQHTLVKAGTEVSGPTNKPAT